ncbi:putative nicotinate phosphoribosyltransferase [Mycobacteroides abscessus subsp. massiliense]|uniref:nicotinate phosphoribosyltransferase n=2 Tax=Mycobacteroides abscessus TaxID=36809 RepID=UPI00092659EB|nr:nicotinate phosphoribosyltransferase [Mycobacteroides abscessus]SHX44414.1 putative nicotinate phosphoribosyltransferase [Mycobacteroides abscessus subsp. abscessus]SKM66624.1 putative nicotinate phosphoribosyltransferase [Mycobacteroides abscessus subsp. massiliense]SKN33189.1 putative nicotinate phosphoribosyltransferase [Mycobacteroides abscessus subsp. massiliense]SKP15099.1 putative nicotinate phosphoribosyltransferase [Mycobacteroides abscessus subsp. massiliense]SKP58754.1 putative n
MMIDYSPVAPLFHTDAYKLDHKRQYDLAGKVTRVYSNYTNRKSRIPGVDKVVHFGLQAYIQRYLMDEFEPFFSSGKGHACRLYETRVAQVLGPDAAKAIGSEHIRALHSKGYLPLRFCAVPEGTLVPIGVPSFTVENTHPDFYWLTNFVETGLSAGIWQASTSATIAREYRKVLEAAAERSGSDLAAVDWQCHDFSYRGMSSHESAAASGAAHLLSFSGTDSLVSLDWIDRYYGGAYVAGSVPATEHSVMCTGIESVGERETFSRLLDLYPTGVVSVVSDTFDLWRVLTEYLPALRDKIVARDGKLVIRPDSGDPEMILCGDPEAMSGTPEWWGVLHQLYDVFGGEVNEAGFIELNPKVGAIYGDSITLDRARSITEHMARLRWASTNVVFGVGSFTYQYNTRDTFGSAMKATWAEVDGEGVNLLKDPVTDDGTKKSATGRLAVLHKAKAFGGQMFLVERAEQFAEMNSLLQPVWEDGEFIKRQTFSDVRNVLAGQ